MGMAVLWPFFNANACTVTPSFSISSSHTCGLPTIVSAYNTSKGNYNSKAKYYWKVNNIITDSTTGIDSIIILLKQIGVNKIKLIVKDSAGCIDSSAAQSITVTSNAKTILDQNGLYTLNPTWVNCIQYITSPDTFSIRFESADTLKKLKILWGDGTTDTAGSNLAPNTVKSHLYNTLGIFTVKIITQNGACTDTVYGTVYSQRQPTAGIIGPTAGSNRGCVPHTLRIVNNSYNISNNTNFEIDWGVGPVMKLPYTSANDTLYNTYRTGICGASIKITASNVCGNSVATWNPIDISDKDIARWTVATTCNPVKPHVFINACVDRYCLLPDLKEYFWDFGDSTTVGWTTSKASQNHIFKTEKDYIITIIVKNGCGYDTFKDIVRVYYNPIAGFNFNTNRGCKPLAVSFTDTSTGRGHTRLWTVKENSTTKTFTDSIFNYTFTQAGVHTVELTVTNPCGTSTVKKTFTVNDKPTAKFSNIPDNCSPTTVNFNNTSTSYFKNPNYQWDFGDSSTSNLKSPPSKIYTKTGTYTVRLFVSDSCGMDTFQQTFTVFGLPKAILSGDTVGCTFDSLVFSNQSTNANNFNWMWGDGNSLNTTSIGVAKHVYTLPGNYKVRLIAAAGTGCKDTAYHTLRIKPGAKAAFTINLPFACAPATFNFKNESVFGKDFNWYANGKFLSNQFNLPDSILLADSSIVRLKLVVTSNSSCQTDSIEKIYFTPKNPKAIINNRDSGCTLLQVNFTQGSTYATKSYWNLGNGLTSNLTAPNTTYKGAKVRDTFYYPQLLVTNWAGCMDSVKTTIKVYPSPTALFVMDKSNGCGPLSVNFTNQSKTNNQDSFNTLNHQWIFGNGNSSNLANANAAFKASTFKDSFYNIKLVITSLNGCTDTSQMTVQVFPLPSIAFTPDRREGCALLPVNFLNTSKPQDTGSIKIMSFLWQSGNGLSSNLENFKASYGSSLYSDTNYQVKLIGWSEHGCADSAIDIITVHPNPIAKFTLNRLNGCTPLQISTDNLSVSNDGKPLSHIWNFGNTYTSTSLNDNTIYTNATNADISFKIWYEAQSYYACKDTAELLVTVHPKPIAKFNLSTKKACAPMVLTVTDASINAALYYWGLNQPSDSGNISEKIHLNGLKLFDTSYTIAHQVASVYGCLSDTVYDGVLVLGRPQADFEYGKDSICYSNSISINNTSLGGFKYLWKFSDNTTSNFINPKHKFPINPSNGKDSTFKVTLEVTSSTSCRDTATKSVYIVNKPIEKMTIGNGIGCTDLTVSLSQSSTSYKTKYWDFGDNSAFQAGDTVKHTYVNALNNLTLQPKIILYRQRFNCTDTSVGYAFVYPKPSANFNSLRNDPCDKGIFQFVNQSKNNKTNEWVFDNGVTSSASDLLTVLTPSKVKDTFYTVKLYITNNYNCKDSILKVIKVKPRLQVRFSNLPVSSCQKGLVDFTNMSVNTVRYLWTFGDGGISTEANPTYIYNSYGNYKVTLYGYDIDGCVDSSLGSNFIKILEQPKADFTYLPLQPKLPNARVDFTARPIMLTSSINNLIYEWDFGDQSFPTKNKNDQNPFHIYTNSGTSNIKLTVWNQQCSDFVIKPLYVEYPKPIVDFTPDTSEGCVPLSVKFKNKTQNVMSYRWVFSDGSPDATDAEPIHIFERAGTWDVTLIATGSGGTVSKTMKYLIRTFPKPLVDFYSSTRFMNLPNAVFSFQNTSDNTVKNDWYVYDSTGAQIGGSTLRNPSFNITETGSFSVKLIGTNSYGCTDTLIKPNYLNTLKPGYVFVPNAFSPNGNGKNDGFKPSVFNVKEDHYIFRIYNRWGEKLFETFDRDELWDGTFKGNNCEQDVYVWTVNGLYENGDNFGLRGTLSLLR